LQRIPGGKVDADGAVRIGKNVGVNLRRGDVSASRVVHGVKIDGGSAIYGELAAPAIFLKTGSFREE